MGNGRKKLFHVLGSLEDDESVTFVQALGGGIRFYASKNGRCFSEKAPDDIVLKDFDANEYFAEKIADFLVHLRG